MSNVIQLNSWKPKEGTNDRAEEKSVDEVFAEAEARNKAAKKARERERRMANEQVKQSYKLKGEKR